MCISWYMSFNFKTFSGMRNEIKGNYWFEINIYTICHILQVIGQYFSQMTFNLYRSIFIFFNDGRGVQMFFLKRASDF